MASIFVPSFLSSFNHPEHVHDAPLIYIASISFYFCGSCFVQNAWSCAAVVSTVPSSSVYPFVRSFVYSEHYRCLLKGSPMVQTWRNRTVLKCVDKSPAGWLNCSIYMEIPGYSFVLASHWKQNMEIPGYSSLCTSMQREYGNIRLSVFGHLIAKRRWKRQVTVHWVDYLTARKRCKYL